MIFLFRALAAMALVLGAGFHGASAALAGEEVPLSALPHVQGLAVDTQVPGRLLLATHEGLFAATADGKAVRIGASKDDLMGFSADPGAPGVLYASGHPAQGGNLGVLRSADGGLTWSILSDGAGGPVDFHAITVSIADPSVLYGLDRRLQVSRDGGRSWAVANSPPKDTFDLAASALDPHSLYAAARGGLWVSRDAGDTWRAADLWRRPATLVQATPGGRLYAFVYGVGLLVARESVLKWKTLADGFGNRYLLHLAVDPGDPERLYAVADTGAVMVSKDGGRSWIGLQGSLRATPENIAAGARLYNENCAGCHGVRGVGERPGDMYARDEYGFVAPPLDDTAHGWHHSDDDLVAIILNGSSRNERMIAWKLKFARRDSENIVAYIKSLWSFSSHACQGARHMQCMN